MPLIQKVVRVGGSRAVVLPKSWLDFYTEKYGQPVNDVELEVNDELLIRPHMKEATRRVV